MIAPCDVVAQLLVAAIALLALTFGILQFYPRIVAMWKPRSIEIPISQLVQFEGVKRLLRKIKLAIGLLAVSIVIGILYLLAAALSVLDILIPVWLDILMIIAGLILLAGSITFLTLGAILFKEEEINGASKR